MELIDVINSHQLNLDTAKVSFAVVCKTQRVARNATHSSYTDTHFQIFISSRACEPHTLGRRRCTFLGTPSIRLIDSPVIPTTRVP